jgi:hypothetical protein
VLKVCLPTGFDLKPRLVLFAMGLRPSTMGLQSALPRGSDPCPSPPPAERPPSRQRPPLQAGVYDIMVRRRVPPGVPLNHWEFSNQDGGFLWPGRVRTLPGRVLCPDDSTVVEWCQYVLEAFVDDSNPLGGWGPARSCQVQWMSNQETYLYRCGDDNVFDIEQCQRRQAAVDLRRLEGRVIFYDQYLRQAALSSHRRYRRRIFEVIRHEWEHFARVVRCRTVVG